jgi:hypothetical protein
MADVVMTGQLLMSCSRGWYDTVATVSLFELFRCIGFGTVFVSACRFRNVRLLNAERALLHAYHLYNLVYRETAQAPDISALISMVSAFPSV